MPTHPEHADSSFLPNTARRQRLSLGTPTPASHRTVPLNPTLIANAAGSDPDEHLLGPDVFSEMRDVPPHITDQPEVFYRAAEMARTHAARSPEPPQPTTEPPPTPDDIANITVSTANWSLEERPVMSLAHGWTVGFRVIWTYLSV